MDLVIKRLCKEISEEDKVDVKDVQEAVRSQFKFVKDVMERGKHENVQLMYFGKFAVNPGRLKHLKKVVNSKLG